MVKVVLSEGDDLVVEFEGIDCQVEVRFQEKRLSLTTDETWESNVTTEDGGRTSSVGGAIEAQVALFVEDGDEVSDIFGEDIARQIAASDTDMQTEKDVDDAFFDRLKSDRG